VLPDAGRSQWRRAHAGNKNAFVQGFSEAKATGIEGDSYLELYVAGGLLRNLPTAASAGVEVRTGS
jgi:hypothetical protein